MFKNPRLFKLSQIHVHALIDFMQTMQLISFKRMNGKFANKSLQQLSEIYENIITQYVHLVRQNPDEKFK